MAAIHAQSPAAGRRSARAGLLPALAVTFCVAGIPPAHAHHITERIELLTPALVGMQYGMICTGPVPGFMQAAAGQRGTILQYAEHIRDELLPGLGEKEARAVLQEAAERAKAMTLQEIRRLDRGGVTDAAVLRWCETWAKDWVLRFMRAHDEDHASFVGRVRSLPRDGHAP